MQANAKAVWNALEELPRPRLADLFAGDGGRAGALSGKFALPGGGEILFDWSKTHLDAAHLALFGQLADAMDLAARRAALFAGEIVNASENRPAGHVAERGSGDDARAQDAARLHARMAALVDAVHKGLLGEVRHVIHIGIGGSALGPALAIDALAQGAAPSPMGIDVHVVSNVDGCALEAAFDACDPAATLIVVASKTFTTTETMLNAKSALAWLGESGVADPFGQVVALTADPDKAVEWGVDETRVLPFSASVGGRYSLWSAIGFPVALALGWPDFAELLEGAQAMDRHFLKSAPQDNLCLRAAFADQIYTRLRSAQTRAVFAYDERLRLLPSYLQQLEMESNGKSVTAEGEPVSGPTAPVTWGGVGTDAQHAVFQLLHQGTHLVPVEFLACVVPGDDLDAAHHRTLLANCFAQGAALMTGQDNADPARRYPGDRPSATILLDDLTPAALGALIAFYEHRTFANAVLMGINPFDQFGVELGKQIARSIETGQASFDQSTMTLLATAWLG